MWLREIADKHFGFSFFLKFKYSLRVLVYRKKCHFSEPPIVKLSKPQTSSEAKPFLQFYKLADYLQLVSWFYLPN